MLPSIHRAPCTLLTVLFLSIAACLAQIPPATFSPWVREPVLPQARGGVASAWLDGHLVVAGGSYWHEDRKQWSDRVDAYDPETRSWIRLPPIPAAVASPGFASSNDGLYLVGGTGADGGAVAVAWKLTHDGATWTWNVLPALPEARAYGAAALLGDWLYFAASTPDPEDLQKAGREVYRLNVRRPGEGWHAAPLLPEPGRCLAALAAIGDRLYLFGGCRGNASKQAVNLSEALRLDAEGTRWEPIRSLPRGIRAAAAVSVDRDKIAIVGGYSAEPTAMERYGTGYGFERRILLYDTKRNRYGEGAPLPIANAAMGLALHPDRLSVVGGEDRARSRTDAHYSVARDDLRSLGTRRPLLVCLGDSVTDGVGRSGVTGEETYPRVLERILSGRDPAPWVIRAGKGGENTRQALQRFTSVVKPLPRVDYVVIMYGLNDAAMIDGGPVERAEPRIPLTEYTENLRALVAEVRRQGGKPILCTPNPMTPAYPYASRGAYARAGDVNFMVRTYATAVRRLAEEEKAPLVDVDRVFRRVRDWEKLFPDGIHPNAAGLAMIAEAVKAVLQPPNKDTTTGDGP